MFYLFFFFKQKTAYELRISDWSSDVCSSDLSRACARLHALHDGLPPLPPGAARSADDRPGRRLARQVLSSPPAPHARARDRARPAHSRHRASEIGRASCRERESQCVLNSGVGDSIKKKKRTIG